MEIFFLYSLYIGLGWLIIPILYLTFLATNKIGNFLNIYKKPKWVGQIFELVASFFLFLIVLPWLAYIPGFYEDMILSEMEIETKVRARWIIIGLFLYIAILVWTKGKRNNKS